MNRARKMVNEATLPPIAGVLHHFPGLEAIGKEQEERSRPTWLQRRAVDLGVLAMPDTPPPSPGFYVNWTTVTGLIALFVLIGSLFAFTWSVAYQQGAKEAELQQMRERLASTEKKAEAADTKATYAVSGADTASGHKRTSNSNSGGH